MRACRCLFNTSPAIWSVILQYAADTCAEDQQHYTIETSCATSVATSASLLLDLVTFQTPLATLFPKIHLASFRDSPVLPHQHKFLLSRHVLTSLCAFSVQ